MDHEQPRQELVKCVVVGDTAVGKTRLICARACNKQFSLTQLLNTHVPTVFAIDQYRIYKDVLERSWVMVDGVNVSLRLWDTFGDHDKDRRFAYGRSDVVLLCFSVSSAISLRNCRAVWYPEIRKFCPNTPILLVGCKNDLRHICNDDQYISYCKDRSPLVRPTRDCDLVMPGEGRALAREMGADYYETSVLSFYGVREVFDNVVRSALIARKQQRFWMANLKRVQRPIPQVPYCPPKPKLVEANVCPSSIPEDLHLLYHSGELTDLVLVAGSTVLCAHRFILAAASTAFHKLFASELTDSAGQRRCSDSSMQSGTFGDSTAGGFNSDTECLLSLSDHTSASSKASTRLREALKRRSSMQSLPFDQRQVSHRELSHPAFHSISVEQWYEKSSCAALTQFKEGSTWPSNLTSTQTVVALNVDGAALRHAVHFAYTGSILCRKCQLPLPDLGQLREVAQLLELGELNEFLAQLLKRDEFSSGNDAQEYLQVLQCRLRALCVESLCCDVLFQLEDGVAPAHRALLMSRCDMMHAMFASGFRESNARVVSFPDIKLRTFQILLQYLYKDMVPTLKIRECLPTVELANRLCLPRLTSLVESEIINLFNRVIQAGGDVSEDCLCLLEPLQVYNADQLADWCLSYIASNYNNVCYKYAKLIRALHPENQAWLNRHRWPPVWYLKDFDFYERCLIERQREAKPIKPPKTSSGCLCFPTSLGRREDKAIEYHTIPQHSFSLSY